MIVKIGKVYRNEYGGWTISEWEFSGNWSYSIYLYHWPIIHIIGYIEISPEILRYFLIVCIRVYIAVIFIISRIIMHFVMP